jgi:hypothetical protein
MSSQKIMLCIFTIFSLNAMQQQGVGRQAKKIDMPYLLENDAQELRQVIKKRCKQDGDCFCKFKAAIRDLDFFLRQEDAADVLGYCSLSTSCMARQIAQLPYDGPQYLDALKGWDFDKITALSQKNCYIGLFVSDGNLSPLQEMVMQNNLCLISAIGKELWLVESRRLPLLRYAKHPLMVDYLYKLCAKHSDEKEAIHKAVIQQTYAEFMVARQIAKNIKKRDGVVPWSDFTNAGNHTTECGSSSMLEDALSTQDYSVRFLLQHGACPLQTINKQNLFQKIFYNQKKPSTTKKIDYSVLNILQEASLFFIPFEYGDIVALLRNGAQGLQQLCDELPLDEKQKIEEFLATFFAVLARHDATKRVSGYPVVTMLPEGYFFNNASFDDLNRLVGKDGVEYVIRLLMHRSQHAVQLITNKMLFQQFVEK